MDAVILVVPDEQVHPLLARLADAATLQRVDSERYVLGVNGEFAFLDLIDGPDVGFEPEELNDLQGRVPHAVFLALRFRDIELCKRLLRAAGDDPRLIIDNDHGDQMSGAAFVRRLRDDPSWNWREP